MRQVLQRAAAWCDLIDHYIYLAENAGDAVADLFLIQGEATYVELAEHPEMG